MAQCVTKVYLGYEDEAVNEKNKSLQHYTVNKIGGYPDWPPFPKSVNFSSSCRKCGLNRLLITQCYAPLEKSQYHRSLYIFACINPQCWELSDSWTCVRSQIKDESHTKTETAPITPTVSLNWCSGADDWDENDSGDVTDGNNVDLYVDEGADKRLSDDEEEETQCLEMESIESSLEKMQFCDNKNATSAHTQDAFEAVSSLPDVDTELESGNQEELVSVDAPLTPSVDIQKLLLEKVELPNDILKKLSDSRLHFVPKFIAVEEEFIKASNVDDARVNKLLHKYRKENGEIPDIKNTHGLAGNGMDDETYEESFPLHGDRIFHAFVSRLQANPGQILRYSRSAPLLGAPLLPGTHPPVCLRCGSRYVCELQLVPAFASTLYLAHNVGNLSHLQFLSVLVFTCVESCWTDQDIYVEEPVVIQPEIF